MGEAIKILPALPQGNFAGADAFTPHRRPWARRRKAQRLENGRIMRSVSSKTTQPVKESQIVRQILDYLAAERIFAFRLNTSATQIGTRFFRAHSLGPGTADIFSIRRSSGGYFHPLWIEVKTAKGKQSREQELFQKYVESNGHTYILARDVEQVKGVLESAREGLNQKRRLVEWLLG